MRFVATGDESTEGEKGTRLFRRQMTTCMSMKPPKRLDGSRSCATWEGGTGRLYIALAKSVWPIRRSITVGFSRQGSCVRPCETIVVLTPVGGLVEVTHSLKRGCSVYAGLLRRSLRFAAFCSYLFSKSGLASNGAWQPDRKDKRRTAGHDSFRRTQVPFPLVDR